MKNSQKTFRAYPNRGCPPAEREKPEAPVKFIESCDGCLVREAMSERYINGRSWVAVSHRLGGYIKADTVRKMVERYLIRQEEKKDLKSAEIQCIIFLVGAIRQKR